MEVEHTVGSDAEPDPFFITIDSKNCKNNRITLIIIRILDIFEHQNTRNPLKSNAFIKLDLRD